MRRDLLCRLPRLSGGRLHLVLALVGVGDEMAHIGDVDDVGDVEALGDQEALEQVGEEP